MMVWLRQICNQHIGLFLDALCNLGLGVEVLCYHLNELVAITYQCYPYKKWDKSKTSVTLFTIRMVVKKSRVAGRESNGHISVSEVG